MNRYCSATPTSDSIFECFDNDPGVLTNNSTYPHFEDYISEVEANPNGVCDDFNETIPMLPEEYANFSNATSISNGELVPFHDIVVCSRIKTSRSNRENCIQGNGGKKWDTLEVDRARHAMYATLIVDDDHSTTPAPTPSSSGTIHRHGGKIIIATIILSGLLIRLVWVS